MGLLDAFESSSGSASSRPGKGSAKKRIFFAGVVKEVITNPVFDLNEDTTYEEDPTPLIDSLKTGKLKVRNQWAINKMPRNTLVVQIVSDKASKEKRQEICYPFFSPHLSMPVKPGEQVWIIYEYIGGKGPMGYWMCRVPGSENVDDLNYTHLDRGSNVSYMASPEDSASVAFDDVEGEVDPFTFPAGGGAKPSNQTLPGEDPYQLIVDSSDNYIRDFTGEPVPRFSKRSPDFVIQGSNNTLICLGEDRISPITSTTDPAIVGKGAIDIVAGRGYVVDGDNAGLTTSAKTLADQDGKITIGKAEGDTNITTPSAVAENAREFKEVDKTPAISQNNTDGPNPNEGNPDFKNDLSRIYISMKTNIDDAFELDLGGDVERTDYEAEGSQPAIALKTDEIRLIARDNIKITVTPPGASDTGASIILKADGDVVFVPGEFGVIKLGGESANRAILTTIATTAEGPTVAAAQIADTFGGQIGTGVEGNGIWATKVLVL